MRDEEMVVVANLLSTQIKEAVREGQANIEDFQERVWSYDGTTGVIDIDILELCLRDVLAVLEATRKL